MAVFVRWDLALCSISVYILVEELRFVLAPFVKISQIGGYQKSSPAGIS